MKSGFSIGVLALVAVLVLPAGGLRADPPKPAGGGASKEKGTNEDRPKDPKKGHSKRSKMPALQFTMKDIDGNEQDLGQYHGQVVLIVNTASECGLTPQYEGLQALYEEKKDEGFVILAFPANEFGRQEPGSDEEIKTFCTSKYKVTFPIFSKVCVKGEALCDLFKYLTAKDAGHDFGGPIQWNFNKFLIGRDGQVIGRFEPPVPPNDEKVRAAVDKALAAPAPPKSPWAKNLRTGKSSSTEKERVKAEPPQP